jgi:hypothetical protein
LAFVQIVDGVFWISFADLLYEFQYLLVNKVFYKNCWNSSESKQQLGYKIRKADRRPLEF